MEPKEQKKITLFLVVGNGSTSHSLCQLITPVMATSHVSLLVFTSWQVVVGTPTSAIKAFISLLILILRFEV
jgi:hypothetical protein